MNRQPPRNEVDPLPRNLEAERALLGQALLDGLDGGAEGLAERLLAETSPSDFYSPRHMVIRRALQRILGSSGIFEPCALRDELEARGDLEQAGGWEYLESLSMPTTAGFDHHLNRVRSAAVKRSLAVMGTELSTSSRDGTEAEEVLLAHETKLAEIRRRLDGDERQLVRASAVIGERISGHMPPPLPTGIPDLDRQLGGGVRAGFNPVGGRSGRGKTTLVNQIVANAAVGQVPCFVVTLEDSIARQAAVMVARLASVDAKEIGTGRYTTEKTQSAAEKEQIVEDAWAYFREKIDPFVTFTEEARLARLQPLIARWARRHESFPHRVVHVDTAHNLVTDGDSLVDRMDNVAQTLKRLQAEHGLILFATCHMSRGGELRGSSDFEYLADLNLRLEAEDPADVTIEDSKLDFYCRTHDTVGVRVGILKDKVFGGTGEVSLMFHKPYGRFAGRGW